MAIPETPTAATPPSLKPTRTPAQAWTRFAQVMSFMLILGSLAFGIFVSVEGSGGLISETWGFLKVIFYLPLFLLIPLIVSLVVNKKHKIAALVISLVTFFLVACLAAFLVVFISVSGG
jgi:cytochrome bd-type quinol oxidase subunit 2